MISMTPVIVKESPHPGQAPLPLLQDRNTCKVSGRYRVRTHSPTPQKMTNFHQNCRDYAHARSNRPPVAPTSTSNPVQGHGMGQLHGQARTRDRHTNVQCYECHGWGHMKRECPTLLTKQNTGRKSVSTPPLSHRPASPLYPFYDHSTPSSNSIALN